MIEQRRGRWVLSMVALFAVFGVALHGPILAAAQDDPTAELDFKSLDGYQLGAGRVWMGDMSALLGGLDVSATPGAEMKTPDFSSLGLFMMTGLVAEFDNGDHAASAFGSLSDEVVKSLDDGESGINLAEADGEKIGDQSKTFAGSFSEEGVQGQLTMVIVQKGDFVYASFGMGFGTDPANAVNSLVKDMTNNKPGDGDGTFNENGTSTGGLWDVFPSSDAEYLKGLTPMSDQDLSQDTEE